MPRWIRPASLRLPNTERERHASWLEIFFDLIFAVIVTQIASRIETNLTLTGILQCSVLFFPVLWTWICYTVFAARFDNDDAIHWLLTFCIMLAGIIMAIHIPIALERGAFGFTLGFFLGQVATLLLYFRALHDSSISKNLILFYLIGFGCAGLCWGIALFFSPPHIFIFWILGMLIYLIVPWIGRKNILSKAPLDSFYIPDRFGSFTVIILGQAIASVIFGLEYTHWNSPTVATGLMAFIITLLIWGQYYRLNVIVNFKCNLSSGQPFIYAHIPLIMSLILMVVCMDDYIKSPLITHENVNMVFGFATILYITSFYLLQYAVIHRIQIREILLVSGILAIIITLLLQLFAPWITMLGYLIVFGLLFIVQYFVGCKRALESL